MEGFNEERLMAEKITDDYARKIDHLGKGAVAVTGAGKDILVDSNLSPERLAGYLKDVSKQLIQILMSFSTSGLSSSMRFAALCGVNLPGLPQLQSAVGQRLQATVGRNAMRFADLARQSRPGEDRMGLVENEMKEVADRVDRLEKRVRSNSPRPGR